MSAMVVSAASSGRWMRPMRRRCALYVAVAV